MINIIIRYPPKIVECLLRMYLLVLSYYLLFNKIGLRTKIIIIILAKMNN